MANGGHLSLAHSMKGRSTPALAPGVVRLVPDAALPQGAERSEKFVLVFSEYFERIDVRAMNSNDFPQSDRLSIPVFFSCSFSHKSIQTNIRSSLAYILQPRIAPSAINPPSNGFVPPLLGAGHPGEGSRHNFGLQEERVEWNAILSALAKSRDLRS